MNWLLDNDMAMTLAILEDEGYIDESRKSRLRRAAIRMRRDWEIYGSVSVNDILSTSNLDNLTQSEIRYMENIINRKE